VKALLETDLRHDPDALVQGAEYSLEAGLVDVFDGVPEAG